MLSMLWQVWDMPGLQFVTCLQGHRNWVRSAVFNSDGRLAVSGGDDYTVRLWDVRTKRCARIYSDPSDRLNKVGFVVDGLCVASAGTLRLFGAACFSSVITAVCDPPYLVCSRRRRRH